MATPLPAVEHDWIDRIVSGRYALREVIGEGGMGTVFRAHQLGVGRDVAIKVLRPAMAAGDPHVAELFYREARAASRLNHPNIVTVFDFGQTDDHLLFIAMELIEGRSLTEVNNSGLLSLVDQLRVAIQVCGALAEAHAEGVVHRDMKPDNILLCQRRWNPHVVKILDFGLAKVMGTPFETGQTGMRFGTPLYMSPEQILGRPLDHRADIYAMGALLFELFTGRPPFSGRTPVHICMQHVDAEVPSLASWSSQLPLPPELDDLVRSMLAKDADQRPADIDQVRKHLEDVLSLEGALAPTTEIARPGRSKPGVQVAQALRIAQPISVDSLLPHAAAEGAESREYTQVVALPVPPGTGLTGGPDPQASITQLVPEISHLHRGRLLARSRPSPSLTSTQLSSAAALSADLDGNAVTRQVAPPGGERIEQVGRDPRPAPAPQAKAGDSNAFVPKSGAGEPSFPAPTNLAPNQAMRLDPLAAPAPSAARAGMGTARARMPSPAPKRPRTLRLHPQVATARHPRPHIRKLTFWDHAEYVARAVLAALFGAGAGFAVYWALFGG